MITFDDFEKKVSEYGNIILKNIRLHRGLTQRELGTEIGKKEITIRSYENKNSKVTLEILFIITRKLKVTKDEFVKINANYYSTQEYIDFFKILVHNLYSFSEFEENKGLKKMQILCDKIFCNAIDFYISNISVIENKTFYEDEKKEIIDKTLTFLKQTIKKGI